MSSHYYYIPVRTTVNYRIPGIKPYEGGGGGGETLRVKHNTASIYVKKSFLSSYYNKVEHNYSVQLCDI